MKKTAHGLALDRVRRAQVVANQTIIASHDLQRAAPQFRRGWDAAWVNQLNARLLETKTQCDARPLVSSDIEDALRAALLRWWAELDGTRSLVHDTDYRYICYRAKHPSASFSDEMMVRRAERGFALMVGKAGGLGTVQSMGVVSTDLIRLAYDYRRHNLGSGVCRSVEVFVKRSLPVILTYTRYLGARVAA